MPTSVSGSKFGPLTKQRNYKLAARYRPQGPMPVSIDFYILVKGESYWVDFFALVNQEIEAGGHEVTLQAGALSSGVYFYQLSFQRSANPYAKARSLFC